MSDVVQQGDEADEAKHIEASQLIPSVRPTGAGAKRRPVQAGVADE